MRDGSSERQPDVAAVVTVSLVAALSLGAAWMLPWWIMDARAPQYGQRTLTIAVGPRAVEGDLHEIDTLGHYVGIHPLGDLATFERKFAPVGLIASAAGLLLAAWLRRRAWRLLAVLPALLLPAIFLADLSYWMNRTVNDRDADAALSLTVSAIDTKLFGTYSVGQFVMMARPGAGLFATGTAALLGLGLVFATPLAFGFKSRKKRQVQPAVTAVVIGTILWPTLGRAAEYGVRSGQSVAQAMAAAAEGDTLRVPAGTYHEHLVITKRLRLIGEPGAILDGGGSGTVVRIEAPNVELCELSIRGSGDSYTMEDAAVRIDHAPNVKLSRITITDSLFGIFAAQADDCVIESSAVVGKNLPPERRGDGIRLWYSSRCILSANRVMQSRDVVIWYSQGTRVEDNVVREGRYGLHYMYSDNNIFKRNVFEDNQVGATVMNSRGIELTDNSFSFSNGPSAYGLLLKDADDVFITHNRFVGNATALMLDDAPESRGGVVQVHRNLIARNGVGVAVQPLSRGATFWENSFEENRLQVQVLGSGNASGDAWAKDGRGNYWSDAVVYDPRGDGVSLLPYRVESAYEALAQRRPELAFFAGTPAAEAIDQASRLFPLFAPRPQMSDPHPLVHPPLEVEKTDRSKTGGVGMAATGGGLTLAAACLLLVSRRVLA